MLGNVCGGHNVRHIQGAPKNGLEQNCMMQFCSKLDLLAISHSRYLIYKGRLRRSGTALVARPYALSAQESDSVS